MRFGRGSAPGLLLVVVALVTACGGEGGNRGDVATAGGTPSSSAGNGQLSDQDKAVKYTQCLREHGIAVADPEDGRPAAIEQGTASEDKVQAAQQACERYQPTLENRRLDADQLEKLRQVAKCLREHGYPDFPDPDPDQGGIVLGESSGIDVHDPAFKAAEQECGMGGPPPSGGTGDASNGGQRVDG